MAGHPTKLCQTNKQMHKGLLFSKSLATENIVLSFFEDKKLEQELAS